MTVPWYDITHDLTLALVGYPSVTNTPSESTFADHLLALVRDQPYFREHPEQTWLEPIPDDPHRRRNVFALVRGREPTTVVLTGHYDVVSVANYGALEPWAFDPLALLPRMVTELRRGSRSAADDLALADLESGAFLPGRGALDMKSGLAAGLAVLFHLAASSAPRGTILFIATPDEEDSSYGMRGATRQLPAVSRTWGLSVIGAINLDGIDAPEDGREGQAIFFGSVGKLLPSAYIVGRDTHAGYPFEGINPNLLAAAITRRIECNVALADAAEGEIAPPPTCLQQIDLKRHYDVTTPATAWCIFNVLSHTRTPDQLLTRFKAEVEEAVDEAVAALAEQGRLYTALTGKPVPQWHPRILTFAELKAQAFASGSSAVEDALAALAQLLADDLALSLPQISQRLTEAVWQWSGLTGPAVVIGFASLYYPPVLVGKKVLRHTRLREVASRQPALSEQEGVAVQLRSFFPGISDMSLLGAVEEVSDVRGMLANTPPYGSRIGFDYDAVQALEVPVINVGPWGRDSHKRTERVYMPYTFGQLPELVHRIVQELLA